MEQKFKIGDLVVLKTGSDDPGRGYYFDGTYRCAWFDETNEYREIFSQDVLKLVTRKSK